MKSSELVSRVLAYLREQGYQVDADTKLIEDGILDSVSLIELVTFIEEQCGLDVPDEFFQADNFATVTVIAERLDL